MFFNGWSGILRLLLVGVPAYIALVLLLRVSGKRTLSKLNAFDFVVTVAFGSILATALLDRTLPLLEVVAAFVLLVLLQLMVTWSAVRSRTVDRIVKNEPALLYHDGSFLHDAMRRERVTEGEILAAARSQGHGDVASVRSVVLETDGTLSVIRKG